MNWNAVGALGAIIGAFAVFATLAYLAAQVRQSTKSIKTSTFQQVVSGMAHAVEQLNHDAELTRIWYAGLHDFAGLDRFEQQRFATYFTGILRRYENNLFQTDQGTLDTQYLTGLDEQMRFIMTAPGSKQWWQRARSLFNAPLQDFVERQLATNEQVREPT